MKKILRTDALFLLDTIYYFRKRNKCNLQASISCFVLIPCQAKKGKKQESELKTF
jgi:hypothetical protein